MKKIETYEQLVIQRSVTRIRIAELEGQINNDFEELKNEMKPWKIVRGVMRDLVASEKTDLVGASAGITVESLVNNVLFRKSNFITRTIVAFIAKNYTRNLVSKNSESIIDWMKSVFLKKGKHHHNGHSYDESAAGVDWEI